MIEFELEITHDGRVFHFTYRGTADMAAMYDYSVQRYSDPRLERALLYLFDLTELDFSEVESAEIKSSAAKSSNVRSLENDNRPTVWVAPSDHQFGCVVADPECEAGVGDVSERIDEADEVPSPVAVATAIDLGYHGLVRQPAKDARRSVALALVVDASRPHDRQECRRCDHGRDQPGQDQMARGWQASQRYQECRLSR